MPSVPGANKERHSFSKRVDSASATQVHKTPGAKTPTNSHNQLTQSWQNLEPIRPAERTPEPQRSGDPRPHSSHPGGPRPHMLGVRRGRRARWSSSG